MGEMDGNQTHQESENVALTGTKQREAREAGDGLDVTLSKGFLE